MMRAAIAAFLAAVAAGIVWMRVAGAPASFLIVNAVAAFIALAFAAVLFRRSCGRLEVIALWLAPAAMAASIALGPDLDGVHRWLAIGPLRLHAAALFGPAFLVAFQRRADWLGSAAAIIVAGLAALQPDASVALALVCATGLALAFEFRPHRLLALVAGAGALIATAIRPDRLAPVPFVENVLQDAGRSGGVLSLLIPLALIAAIAAPFLRSTVRRAEAAAISGWFLGLAAASLFGPFPTPLIGYGAAPIIGYGIALGLLGPAPAAKPIHI